jgi:uncharacterized cupin superfamily protein
MTHDFTKVVDSVVIPAGLSAPWWVQYSTTWLGWIAVLAAAIVGVWRVVQLFRNGKRD